MMKKSYGIFLFASCISLLLLIGNVTKTSAEETNQVTYNQVIEFSGYTWEVKNSGNRMWGPGPNRWSNSSDNVWVDSDGRLHLKITHNNGVWYSAEVVNTQTLGYGTYRFYIDGRPDRLDPNVVLGLFTYDGHSEDAEKSNYREIDIEFIKWGDSSATNLSYTVQPYIVKENMETKDTRLNGTYSTHSFNWRPDRVDFMSLHGHRTQARKPFVINEWSYTGPDVPNSKNEKVDINLWLFQGQSPKNNKEVEMVISKFEFIPFIM